MPADYMASLKPKRFLEVGEGKCPLEEIFHAEMYYNRTGRLIDVYAPNGLGVIPESIFRDAVEGRRVDRKWIGKGF